MNQSKGAVKMKKRILALLMIVCLCSGTMTVHGEGAPYELPEEDDTSLDKVSGSAIELTAEGAVAYALAHNHDLQVVSNEIAMASVTHSILKENAEKYEEAADTIEAAKSSLKEANGEINDAEDALEAAWDLLKSGYTPVDIPYKDDAGEIMYDDSGEPLIMIDAYANIEGTIESLVLVKGADEIKATVKGYYDQIVTMLTSYGLALNDAGETPIDIPSLTGDGTVLIESGKVVWDVLEDMVEAAVLEEYSDYIDTSVEAVVEAVEEGLEESEVELEESTTAYEQAVSIIDLYEVALEDSSGDIMGLIDYKSTITLDGEDGEDLLIKLGRVQLDISKYAEEIYRNKIAMLIQKNYYDALYAEKILALKVKAMERGQVQYDMVKLSYENGMKAKDDYILSKMYHEGTILSYRLAEATYNNALYELKLNMGMPIIEELLLTDQLEINVDEIDIEAGLKSGLTNRIEIQKCLGQLMIYTLSEEIIDDSYSHSDFEYREAKCLLERAEINLDQTKGIVEAEIYQSYELATATGDMVELSATMVDEAKEVVEIANLKYEQGFGLGSSLLNNMNLSSSSGTIIELIAAQENLASVEAQVANIRYNYTMARIKYDNDAAILTFD